MSAQKLMIIVLVALVVIFVITIGIGGCHGSGEPSPKDSGAVGALKGLQGNRFLEIGDKATTTCGQPGPPGSLPARLTVSGQCRITFEERAFFRRSTRVVFRPSAGITVFTNPENGEPRTDSVGAGECFASAIDHAGGTMTLFGNATIVLQRQGCPE
jgi:hypothetical protein